MNEMTHRVMIALYEAIKKQEDECFSKGEPDFLTVDGHLDLKLLATAAIEAVLNSPSTHSRSDP